MTQADSFKRLAILWTRAQPAVGGFIAALVRDFSETDDILQQVAVTVVEKFDQYDESRPFVPWAIGIARLEVMAHFRKRSVRQRVQALEAMDDIVLAYEELEPELPELHGALRECLSRLRGRARSILLRRYADNTGPAAISRALGISPGNVSLILHRTREALRRCIEKRMLGKAGEP